MKNLFTLLFILSYCALYSQDKECLKKWKTGKFIGISEDQTINGFTVERTKKKQIESLDNGNSKIISKIEWINDSTYTLTTIEMINTPDGCDKVGAVGTFIILKCDDEISMMKWSQNGCGEGICFLKREN